MNDLNLAELIGQAGVNLDNVRAVVGLVDSRCVFRIGELDRQGDQSSRRVK